MLPRTDILPTAFVLGQIGFPLLDARLRNGADEQRRTEHILILLLQGLSIIGKVEHQRTHQRIALLRNTLGTRLDIRTQLFTLLQVGSNDSLGLVAIVPRFGIAHIAVNTHQGQIHRRLYPAQHPLDILGVVILIAGTEETACVVRPPRHTGSLYAQSGGNLTTERFPVVTHITAP